MMRKAMILAAGLGRRLAPLTPFISKELLPIRGLPAIHQALYELSQVGISEVMIVISSGKTALISYLTDGVMPKGDQAVDLCEKREKTLSKLKITFAEQKTLAGTADAISLAEGFMGRDPVFVLYPDDLLTVEERFDDGIVASRRLIELAEIRQESVLLTEEIEGALASQYGVLTISKQSDDICKVHGIVEKPNDYLDPFAYALIGRMVLTPMLVGSISSFEKSDGAGIVPVLNHAGKMGRLSALIYRGKRFDIGSHEGYQKTLLEV